MNNQRTSNPTSGPCARCGTTTDRHSDWCLGPGHEPLSKEPQCDGCAQSWPINLEGMHVMFGQPLSRCKRLPPEDTRTSKPLVIRLREAISTYHDNDGELFSEAADKIERLTGELAEERESADEMVERHSRNCRETREVMAERERLRAALMEVRPLLPLVGCQIVDTAIGVPVPADETKPALVYPNIPPEAMCMSHGKDCCPWSGDWHETLCPMCKGPVEQADGDPGTRRRADKTSV